ncbi:hypothetical protein [Algoriphagus aquimarinus]|uniref:Uncharacterized protein n=1 Tax=Algoriphagus aquimarinus TaxID=237018 RepID=A0A1I1A5S6_9BACT|nr:hypothetical protein [Algoriphagus aquimarinus]SFB32726.1 hypothetical protein SAMN04489723_107167 [Algoriphagus aquimarinus]
MSTVAICPTCGSHSRIKEVEGKVRYQAVQDEETFKKISQLKKAMEKFKAKAEQLEEELEEIKNRAV